MKPRLLFVAGFLVVSISCLLLVAGRMLMSSTGKAVEGNVNASFDLSPDGRKIVFAAAGNGGKDLFLLNLLTYRVQRLTDSPEYEAYPSFSPDGSQIVYTAASSLSAPRYLYIRSVDGRYVRQLTSGTKTCDDRASFSKDGQFIVFERCQVYISNATGEEPWDDADVYLIKSNGRSLRRITHDDSHVVIRPQLSFDNSILIFERAFPATDRRKTDEFDYVSNYHLARMHASGKDMPHDFTPFGWNDSNASFFPSGRQLVFVSDKQERYSYNLYQMPLSDGVPVPIGTPHIDDQITNPRVTPDGRFVYYLNGYDADLWMVNVLTGARKKIATGKLFSDPLHWKPDI